MPGIAPYDEVTMNNVMTPEEMKKKAEMLNVIKVEGEHEFPETPEHNSEHSQQI